MKLFPSDLANIPLLKPFSDPEVMVHVCRLFTYTQLSTGEQFTVESGEEKSYFIYVVWGSVEELDNGSVVKGPKEISIGGRVRAISRATLLSMSDKNTVKLRALLAVPYDKEKVLAELRGMSIDSFVFDLARGKALTKRMSNSSSGGSRLSQKLSSSTSEGRGRGASVLSGKEPPKVVVLQVVEAAGLTGNKNILFVPTKNLSKLENTFILLNSHKQSRNIL